MANDIQLKRSSVTGKTPDAANVLVGEPVVNLTDKILYTKDGTGNVIVIGAGITSNIAEGTNQYFTNARVYANVTQLGYITSTSLSGYATNAQLATYATNSQLSLYATNAQLTSFATKANSLAQFASTTSAQLAGVISDETGSGALVFATTPTLETPVLGLATGTSVMLSANIGAAAGNVSGNFTAGNFQTAGNVNAASALFTGALTAGTLQTTGNVNSSSLRVTTASSLGTVQSGTWNGSSISTTFTDAKVTSVSNTAPISISTTTGAVTVGMLSSGVTPASYGNATIIPVFTVDAFGRITSSSNVSIGSSGSATVLFSDNPPTSPSGNTLWWQSNTGILKVYYIDADSAQWVDSVPATPSSLASLSNDTTTNSTHFPVFSESTSGSFTSAKLSSTKLTFNPSTGTLAATTFSGAGTLTSLVASGGTAATTTTTGTIIVTGGIGLSGNVFAGGVVSGLDLLSTSDKRLKKNIMTIKNPLNTLQELRGVTFQWKKSGKDSIGVIAQEVEEIIPQIVETGGDGFKNVSYGSMVGLLIEAIKEQQEQINELKRIINAD